MRFVDVADLFEGDPADLAVLSTFQFDADFFERRLLRCPVLVKARRILVFMDAGQWFTLLQRDVPARFLNRRYLVVPVRRSTGVFHPKLNLIVRRESGQVQCGSNNLTRSGCSSNLELLNSVSFALKGENEEAILLAQESYAFFKRACEDADEEAGRIARQWLDELPQAAPWLAVSSPRHESRTVRLVHTYEGSLWDRAGTILDRSVPKRILVISPFYDADAAMVHRVHRRWPKCQIELVVQQQTTNLPVRALHTLRSCVRLLELRNSSRRLHAKLLAWESSAGTGCIVGSANFTTAALDARNVETSLLITDAKELVASLFDKQLKTAPLKLQDFDPGTEHEPESESTESPNVHLTHAVLTETGELRVGYRYRLATKPSNLRVAIRAPGEQRPRVLMDVPNKANGTAVVAPPGSALTDAHGTLLAALVADVGGKTEESSPVWVIQEGRLTYEPSGEAGTPARLRVEETGDGLAEFLEELGKSGGVAAVVEYLRHLNIRFNDGGGALHGRHIFRLRIRDPFRPDVAPEWLVHGRETTDLAEAIYEFTDRHERQRLRRHAKRGNINGLENFLDIFTALVRLLYVYYARGVVQRHDFISRLCRYLELATTGIESPSDVSEGYLNSLHRNLNDSRYLRRVCGELNFAGNLWAALVMVQKVRYVPGERATWGSPRRFSDCLPGQRAGLRGTFKNVGLSQPSKTDVMKALEQYKIFTAAELDELENGMVV